MICRTCPTGYGRCVSWADGYNDIVQSKRTLGDLQWTGTGSYWVTVDPHNGVEVKHAKVRSDNDMIALVCALHLANEERMKMMMQGDSYKPPNPCRLDPYAEMMRQRNAL